MVHIYIPVCKHGILLMYGMHISLEETSFYLNNKKDPFVPFATMLVLYTMPTHPPPG